MTLNEYRRFIGEDLSEVTIFDRLLVAGGLVLGVWAMKKISESAGDKRGWVDWALGRGKKD
jgi:hypothetical protein